MYMYLFFLFNESESVTPTLTAPCHYFQRVRRALRSTFPFKRTLCRFGPVARRQAVKTKFHYAIQLANQLASWFTSWSATW